jgi:hypothetical protein
VGDEDLSSLTVPTSKSIKKTRLRLTGHSVYATSSLPQQPTGLTVQPLCVTQEKARISMSRYVNPSLTCLPDPEDDAILIEPTFDHNARAQGPQLFAVSLSLVLATRACELWIMSRIYRLMNDSEPLTSHQRAPRIQHPR